MSDASDKSREETHADDEPQGPVGGERLAAARREQQISVLEIAKELHLDEPKVRALERNEFDVIGAPVFAKGHLRKYAQLVGVDEADVMADYYQLNRTAGMPPLLTGRSRPRREMSPGPWIAVVVVLIVVATAYWWFTSPHAVVDTQPDDLISEPATVEPGSESEPEPESEPEVEPETETGSAPDVQQSAQSPSTDDSAVLQSAGNDADVPPADRVDVPALGDGQIRLLLTYSGDCWTEITDAGGRRLFFDLGTDGRTVELSGEAPFNVLFGNAENVRMRVNGSDRAITAAERRGRTARLTLAGT